ncbi:MAG: universal stress protein [Alphaproteobacteria bacterium]|jgi:nucleotide-binding universal stress UspA family protein|nr:universal stress protein [Alphaproteobacteria bacterium]|tara:strand:- start:28 stop:897 length:870 start_codon:yes stop_codon:yes gene_type:complete
MTIRTILVSFDGSDAGSATLDAALMLGRQFAVHVDVLHVRPDSLAQVPAIGDGMSGGMAERISRKEARKSSDRAEEARLLFDQACTRLEVPQVDDATVPEGPSVSWIERVGRRHAVTIRLGRVHDLIVVGPPSDPRDLSHSLTVRALFETGRPVLMVPGQPPATIGRRIAVAWNGSAECARALGGASNFFTAADEVVILTAHSDRTPVSVVPELQTYLEHHKVKVETRVFAELGKKLLSGHQLLDACREAGADLLVMGAYREGALRKMVLGSATREVLATADVPLLMGH